MEEIVFPNQIRMMRRVTGKSMQEIADLLGLSISAVSKIEKGYRRLNEAQLQQVAAFVDCPVSALFVAEGSAQPEVIQAWKEEQHRRHRMNVGGGLKTLGAGLRYLRGLKKITLAHLAAGAHMTLSVYHKIEVGQREVYQNEIEPLAKSFAHSVESMFDKIAELYKSGELTKQMNKVKERVKSILVAGDSTADFSDSEGHLYSAKLYETARRKLIPVFGHAEGKSIAFKKSDKTMINAPANLEGRKGVYAIVPNSKRLGGFIPEKSYVFADAKINATVGDLAVFIDTDFKALKPDDTVRADIAVVRKDSKGKIYGQMSSPDEKITAQTMHKVVMILSE